MRKDNVATETVATTKFVNAHMSHVSSFSLPINLTMDVSVPNAPKMEEKLAMEKIITAIPKFSALYTRAEMIQKISPNIELIPGTINNGTTERNSFPVRYDRTTIFSHNVLAKTCFTIILFYLCII